MATKTQSKKASPPETSEKFVSPVPRPDDSIPSLDRTANSIAAHVLADLIDQYLHAKHRHDVVGEKVGSFSGIDEWWDFADQLRKTNAAFVAGAILSWHNKKTQTHQLMDLVKFRANDCGVVYRGRVYAAVALPDYAHHKVGETEGDSEIMGLVEADLPGIQEVNPDLADMVNLDEFFGWNKPAIPVGTRTQAELDASYQELMAKDGLGDAYDAHDAAWERAKARGPAYSVVTQDILLYHEPNRKPLDEVIAEELANLKHNPGDDVAIWQGNKILAALRQVDLDEPIVTRFESPAPSGTASLFGDRIEAPDDVRLNAPPKGKAKEPKPRGKRSPRAAR